MEESINLNQALYRKQAISQKAGSTKLAPSPFSWIIPLQQIQNAPFQSHLLQKEWISQKSSSLRPEQTKPRKNNLQYIFLPTHQTAGVLCSLFPFSGCLPSSFSVASPHLSTSLLQRGKVPKHRNLTRRWFRFRCEAGSTCGLICFPGTPTMIDIDGGGLMPKNHLSPSGSSVLGFSVSNFRASSAKKSGFALFQEVSCFEATQRIHPSFQNCAGRTLQLKTPHQVLSMEFEGPLLHGCLWQCLDNEIKLWTLACRNSDQWSPGWSHV